MKTASWAASVAMVALILSAQACRIPLDPTQSSPQMNAVETQVTHGPGGRILTNTGVWSSDGEWILYDTRSDAEGAVFDGNTIEIVNIRTGQVKKIFGTQNGAHCGVATFHPREWKVIFILGPENPTADWQYGAYHRQGVIAFPNGGATRNLDARDMVPPFTRGALRGGSHVHVWDSVGEWVSFTYEDALLAQFKEPSATNDINQRNVGVSVPIEQGVRVPRTHPRNQDGDFFSVLVTRTVATPKPGSDEIKKACEEGWVGTNGYLRPDGSRQQHALAFQGQIVTAQGETISEVFIVDLPEDVTVPGDGPLQGTATRMPLPPKGAIQRRLTFTADRKFAGIQGPRHWLRSSPDGTRIAFLMKDDAGIVQLWTVSPNGGPAAQLTRNPWPIASAFSWSPDGRYLAHGMDNSICVTDGIAGTTTRLTPRSEDSSAPRPEACVFSPDGKKIAFARRLPSPDAPANQVCILDLH